MGLCRDFRKQRLHDLPARLFRNAPNKTDGGADSERDLLTAQRPGGIGSACVSWRGTAWPHSYLQQKLSSPHRLPHGAYDGLCIVGHAPLEISISQHC
jgi:hypothetical protein